jgi:hypothetical protein
MLDKVITLFYYHFQIKGFVKYYINPEGLLFRLENILWRGVVKNPQSSVWFVRVM